MSHATGLVVGAFAHLIPAATIPNNDLNRAMTEPLADGRDEVIYLICTHPRIRTLGPISSDQTVEVIRARSGRLGTEIEWEREPWARLHLPDHVQLSVIPWSIIDPALESVEGLKPVGFAPSRDPDGWSGRHRQELLGWIFDRHLEQGEEKSDVRRGEVSGGLLDFRLEYIGKSKSEALRRAAGPHHKLPLILNRTLVFEPYRLVYVLPCEPRVATYDPVSRSGRQKMLYLDTASEEFGIDREVLTSAAEEMLIAWLGAIYNKSSTQQRRFPNSGSAAKLRQLGFTEAGIGIIGLPPDMKVQGTSNSVERDTRIHKWDLQSKS